jgi:hypothetical protein
MAWEKSRPLIGPRDLRAKEQAGLFNVFCSCVLCSGVFRASMACKFFIASPHEVLLHFLKRIAGGCSRGIKQPCAFGATPTLKTLPFYPYQFALHDLLRAPVDLCKLCVSIATATTITALLLALGNVPPKPPIFEHTKSEVNTDGLNINDGERWLSVGHQTLARIAISIRGHPRAVE